MLFKNTFSFFFLTRQVWPNTGENKSSAHNSRSEGGETNTRVQCSKVVSKVQKKTILDNVMATSKGITHKKSSLDIDY